MLKKSIMLAVAAVVLGGVLAIYSANTAQAEANTSQQYTPARYAVINAVVQVQSSTDHGVNNQSSLFKIDSTTGQVWMLQATVQSMANPQILNAVWVPVTDISPAQLQIQQSMFQPNPGSNQ
ncbi:MAG: hypothetical protein AB7F32_01530 [Victivallaceae bacterium]